MNCSGVDDNIGEEVEDDDEVFLPPPGAAPAAGGSPGEQARAAGAPKYYSLHSTSVATNSRNASTVRRDTVNRRQADAPLGATLGRNPNPNPNPNRNSRVGEGSVRYQRSGHTSRGRRGEEGTAGGAVTGTGTAGAGGGALMRSSSQRGRQDRRVYASMQPQPQVPAVVGGQYCACGIPTPHFHPNIFPPLNYTLPHNYSIYTPYGAQLPQQYYTLSHPHHQPFIAQPAAAPPPSATASVAYSEHHPNSELYRIFRQSQAQNALPAPSEASEPRRASRPVRASSSPSPPLPPRHTPHTRRHHKWPQSTLCQWPRLSQCPPSKCQCQCQCQSVQQDLRWLPELQVHCRPPPGTLTQPTDQRRGHSSKTTINTLN